MPREIFTIENNGEEFEVEAESPEEALSFIQSQGPTQAPKAFAPRDPSPLESAYQSLPLVPGAVDLAKGQYGAGNAVNTASRALGDVSTAAGLAAPFVASGAAAFPPVAAGIGLGAGIGGLMEATGANKALRHEAQVIRDRAQPVAPFQESNNPIAKALQYAKSIGEQIPNEAGATAVDLLPTLISSLGVAGAAKGMSALKARPQMGRATGTAGLLQDYGGKVTPAMEQFAATGQRRGIAPAMENVARANPLTSGMLEKTDKANIAAMQKYQGERLPKNYNVGGSLIDTFEDFQKRRGGMVSAAKDAARALPPTELKNTPGKAASDSIIAKMEKLGIPVDETGFRTDLMTGKEPISKLTAETLLKVEREMRGAQTGEAINYLQNFDENYGAELRQKYGSAATTAIKEARAVMKEAITGSIEGADKKVGKQYKQANELYSSTQPTVKRALEKIRGETPESGLFDSIFGKSGKHSDKGLARLSRGMNKQEFSKIQDSVAASIVNASSTDDILSLPKLKTALKTLGENKKYLKPEAREGLENLVKMMETASVSELGQPNSSGTGSRGWANAILGGTGGAALLGQPGPAAAALGGSGISAAYLKMPQIKAALGRGVKKLPDIDPVTAAGVSALGSEQKERALKRAKQLRTAGAL